MTRPTDNTRAHAIRCEAIRKELHDLQRSDKTLTVQESDREIGERFARLLRETALSESAAGLPAHECHAGIALERFGEVYPHLGSANHWQAVGFDIRTGTGSASPACFLHPIVNAVALRTLFDGARPELTDGFKPVQKAVVAKAPAGHLFLETDAIVVDKHEWRLVVYQHDLFGPCSDVQFRQAQTTGGVKSTWQSFKAWPSYNPNHPQDGMSLALHEALLTKLYTPNRRMVETALRGVDPRHPPATLFDQPWITALREQVRTTVVYLREAHGELSPIEHIDAAGHILLHNRSQVPLWHTRAQDFVIATPAVAESEQDDEDENARVLPRPRG